MTARRRPLPTVPPTLGQPALVVPDAYPERRYDAEACRITVAGCALWLLKPMGFMNRSGLSVRAFCDYQRLPTAQVLVVHDDLDLPPGSVRLKQGGGAGGHNGLKDVIAQSRATSLLAFVANQYDLTFTAEIAAPALKDLRIQAPWAVCEMLPTNTQANLLVNRDKPPFEIGRAHV